MDDVNIVGAGIAGLACATALAREGANVRVIERAPGLREAGAGIQISPNGYRVLRALGLDAALDAVALVSRAVVLADGPGGREVVRMDLGDAPFRLVHRHDLIRILGEAARDAGVELLFGRAVTAVADGSRARISLDGGRIAEGFVIGADGLHSVIRPALVGPRAPTFTGQIAWRAVVAGDLPPEARIDMGPGRHLVRYPLPGGRVNLVGVQESDAWTAEGWALPGDPEAFEAAFGRFPAARDNLDRVEEVNLWGLFLHPVASRWHGESLALIGDAAHPTLPFLAQGANLALEDAWSLARALRAGALPAWQAERQPRARRAIRAAAANARPYHLRGPARMVAHAGLRTIGRLAPGLLLRRYDWLYRHDVTAA